MTPTRPATQQKPTLNVAKVLNTAFQKVGKDDKPKAGHAAWWDCNCDACARYKEWKNSRLKAKPFNIDKLRAKEEGQQMPTEIRIRKFEHGKDMGMTCNVYGCAAPASSLLIVGVGQWENHLRFCITHLIELREAASAEVRRAAAEAQRR